MITMHHTHGHRPIGDQATRVADDQLALALADLHRTGTAGGDAVHDARRHIRTMRALLRLLRPRLSEDAYAGASGRLRALNRRLAEADAAACALDALGRVMARAEARQARPAIEAIRIALVQRAERSAAPAPLLERAERTLAVERARIGTWEIERPNLAIASGLERCRREAADAMKRALRRPTAGRERAWRRRTTALWLHVRLLEPSRSELRRVRRRLEALDVCLDESHSVVTLERMLMTEALASRRDTAAVLRLLRHYHAELRARAAVYGQEALRRRNRDQARASAATAPVRTTM